MSSLVWSIIGLVSIIFVLGGVALSFAYMQSDVVIDKGFSITNFIFSPGFGMTMLGLFMYHVSGRARKKIKRDEKQ